MHPPLCTQEVDRLMALKRWWADSDTAIAGAAPVNAESSVAMSRGLSSGSGQGGNRKSRCLGELGYGEFSDVIFKVSSDLCKWR